MDLDAARAVLAEQHRCVLATYRRDGGAQTSPVLAVLDDDGYAVVSSRQTAYKVKNLRRDPRAALCVLPDSFFGNWIQIDGTASIVELPEAMDGLVDYYRRASGEHPDWDEYREAMRAQDKSLLRITIERWGPIATGGFPPDLDGR
jgi:PPOX class probable F420-dependent enzyme